MLKSHVDQMKAESSPRRTRSQTKINSSDRIILNSKKSTPCKSQGNPRVSKKIKTFSDCSSLAGLSIGSLDNPVTNPNSKSKRILIRTPGKEKENLAVESKEAKEFKSETEYVENSSKPAILTDSSNVIIDIDPSSKKNDPTISVPSSITPSRGQSFSTASKTPFAKYLQDAKQVFQRFSTPKKLVGRNTERKIISDFILENINHVKSAKIKKHSGALYISGLPGTGKSALVNEILYSETLSVGSIKKNHVSFFINCMAVTAKSIFKHLVKEFGLESTSNEDLITLQDFVTHSGPSMYTYIPFFC